MSKRRDNQEVQEFREQLPPEAAIVIVTCTVEQVESVSQACTVQVVEPAEEGVPESTPPELKLMPVGGEPIEFVQVQQAARSDAVKVKLV